MREVGAEPVQPDACEVLLGVVRVGESEVEVVGVGEALLVRIARRVDRVEAVEAAPDRGEAPALVARLDLRHGHSVLVQVAGARTGLTHTLGGNTATVLVSLFGRG